MEGVFLDVKLLNFILHAYSSTRLRREPPRGGSLSISRAFSYRSIKSYCRNNALLLPSPIGEGVTVRSRMRCFQRNVTIASLLREGDRVSGGRSFSWHRVIKFYTARVLLQSHIRSTAPSRREPLIEFDPFNYRSIKNPLCRQENSGIATSNLKLNTPDGAVI